MSRSLIRSIALLGAVGVATVACQVQPPSGNVSIDPNVPAMQGTTWLWTTSTLAGAETVADPTKFAITFATDGTFSATVDCNQVSGQFTITESNEVDITPGASTRAACPEPSLDAIFLTGLEQANQVEIAADRLVLTGPDGAMTFAPSPSAS